MSSRGPGRPAGTAGQQGREAILRAARALLAEQGTSRVTLRGVAERAGVRPPLVHYYFGSKAELFDAVIEEVAVRLRDQLAEIADHEGTPEERFRAYLAGFIRAMADNPFAPRLIAELVLFPDDERTDRFARDFAAPNAAALSRILQDGQRGGDFDPVDLRFFTPALIGACLFYFLGAPGLRRVLEFDPLDPEMADRYAEVAGDLFLRGIARRGG